MTSVDYRRLRQAEMIAFLVKLYGHRHWKSEARAAAGVSGETPGRWLNLSTYSTFFQTSMEEWTKTLGFRSRYAEALIPFALHAELFNRLRRDALPGHLERVTVSHPDANMPFSNEQFDQLFAALGYDVSPNKICKPDESFNL